MIWLFLIIFDYFLIIFRLFFDYFLILFRGFLQFLDFQDFSKPDPATDPADHPGGGPAQNPGFDYFLIVDDSLIIFRLFFDYFLILNFSSNMRRYGIVTVRNPGVVCCGKFSSGTPVDMVRSNWWSLNQTFEQYTRQSCYWNSPSKPFSGWMPRPPDKKYQRTCEIKIGNHDRSNPRCGACKTLQVTCSQSWKHKN